MYPGWRRVARDVAVMAVVLIVLWGLKWIG